MPVPNALKASNAALSEDMVRFSQHSKNGDMFLETGLFLGKFFEKLKKSLYIDYIPTGSTEVIPDPFVVSSVSSSSSVETGKVNSDLKCRL